LPGGPGRREEKVHYRRKVSQAASVKTPLENGNLDLEGKLKKVGGSTVYGNKPVNQGGTHGTIVEENQHEMGIRRRRNGRDK